MNAFLSVLYAVLPVLCITGAGALLRRINWLTEEADVSLMRITINVLSPCLVLDSIIGNRALENAGTLVLAPVIGFSTVCLGFAVAGYFSRWIGATETAQKRTFALVTGIYNYGYIPLPLALSLFDRETAGVLFVHNVGVEIAMWSVGLLVLTGHRGEGSWRKIINVPLIAILLALGLNLMGARRFLPGFVLETAKMLGHCAIPMGLLLIGATIADYLPEFKPAKGGRIMLFSCLVRLAILPVFFLLLAKFIPLSKELQTVVLLQAAMPSAVFPIILSKHYGGDAHAAVRIVIATTLVGAFTIPIWIRLGMHWLGN